MQNPLLISLSKKPLASSSFIGFHVEPDGAAGRFLLDREPINTEPQHFHGFTLGKRFFTGLHKDALLVS